MFNYNKYSLLGSASTHSSNTMKLLGTATGMGSSPSISGGGNFSSGGTFIGTDFSFHILQDIINYEDQVILDKLYREIYTMDPTSGAAVDLLSSLPWSDYSLLGIEDKKVRDIYEASCEELSFPKLLKSFQINKYVLGRGIGTLVFDQKRGIFSDCIIHNPTSAEVIQIPLIGYDPKIDIQLDRAFLKFLKSNDPRDIEARKELSPELLAKLLTTGKIELEPLKTIFISRTELVGCENRSIYSRILPIWILEKSLTRGTVISSTRRQRPILHITMGCLTGDTLIDKDGELTRLDSVVSETQKQNAKPSIPIDVNFKTKGSKGNKLSTVTVKKWIYQGEKEVFDVVTESNHSICGTANHPFLVVTPSMKFAWVPLEDLSVGDILCIDTKFYTNTNEELKRKKVEYISKLVAIINNISTPTDVNKYYKLIMSDYLFDPIVLIERRKEKQKVYDLTIDTGTGDSAFVANGILVHNSDDWIPLDEDFAAIAQLFANTDRDPLGSIIATRPEVSVNEIRCVSGDTLVSTDRGLKRIDSLIDHDPNTFKGKRKSYPIDIKVKGYDGKFQKVEQWHYSGYTSVCEVKTESGRTLTCTPEHKWLTLDENGLKWKKASQLEGCLVCVENLGYESGQEFPKLYQPKLTRYLKNIKIPRRMTTDLAYLLGTIVGDGYIYPNNKAVEFSSIKKEHILIIVERLQKIFGYKATVRRVFRETPIIYGVEYKANSKYLYKACIASTEVANYFQQLGYIQYRNTNNSTQKAKSHNIEIPHSILTSNFECRYAFLAGLIDADGSIIRTHTKRSVEIILSSASSTLKSQIQTLLADMGYLCRREENIYIPVSSANRLYNNMLPYLAVKSKKPYDFCPEDSKSHKNGIPSLTFSPFIKSRRTSEKPDFKSKRRIHHFDDDGNIIRTFISEGDRLRHYHTDNSFLLYGNFKMGGYKEELRIIREISESRYRLLKYLFNKEYKFEKVVSVTHLKEKHHVYDLTMCKDTKPIFVANGMVIHNSGSDFWRVSDEQDMFTQVKLRAFGLSEALLSGDATVGNADASIVMLLENIRSEREDMTNAVGRDKIFLNLAKYHGFKWRTQAELNHNVRYDSNSRKAKKNETMYKYAVLTGSRNLAEASSYIIPTVKWTRELQAKGSTSDMEMLKSLKEEGIPISVAMLATAAGYNINTILDSYKADIDNRKVIKKYSDELAKLAPKEENEEGAFMASVLPLVANAEEPISFIQDLKNLPNTKGFIEYLAKHIPEDIPITQQQKEYIIREYRKYMKV